VPGLFDLCSYAKGEVLFMDILTSSAQFMSSRSVEVVLVTGSLIGNAQLGFDLRIPVKRTTRTHAAIRKPSRVPPPVFEAIPASFLMPQSFELNASLGIRPT
jgi:hypothetical protein